MKKYVVLAGILLTACASGVSNLPDDIRDKLQAQNENIKTDRIRYVCFDKDLIQSKFPKHSDWYEVEQRGYCKAIDGESLPNLKNKSQFETALITGWAGPGKVVDSYVIQTEDEFSSHFVTRSKVNIVNVIEGEIGTDIVVDIDKVTPGYLKQSQKVLKYPLWFLIENREWNPEIPVASWEYTSEMTCFESGTEIRGLDSDLLFIWPGSGQSCLDISD